MTIVHIAIERYRGIKSLDWTLGTANPICLVGPGDSTKSTILDAIEATLSGRWNLVFSDSDFYDADTSKPFSVRVSISDVPEKLLRESKFGLHLRGWDKFNKCVRDEPKEGDPLIVTLQLRVGSSLEPEWTVITDRTPEGVRISSEDRELLAAVRIDSFVDRHLGWSRGSVLSRLTGKVEEMPTILADAGREARKAFKPDSIVKLIDAAKAAETIVKEFGVLPSRSYGPHLDIREFEIRSGGLSLHDGNVPLRQAGLGTRRLVTMSLQHNEKKTSARPTLIDEVEHGLEPHRLRRLLRTLCPVPTGSEPVLGQVILTTHSPIAVRELAGVGINIVSARDGVINVQTILDDKIQKSLRKYPEAVLGRTILVCEGETEVGFIHALDDSWSVSKVLEPFACLGIVAIDGEGSSVPATAQRFASIGYRVAVLLDSDRPIPEDQLKAAGIHSVLWDGKMCTERRVAEDLPWKRLIECVRLAMNNKSSFSVLSALRSRFKGGPLADDPAYWSESAELRIAIGKSAKENSWFKRVDWGEEMGGVVAKQLAGIPKSDLAVKLQNLQTWLASK